MVVGDELLEGVPLLCQVLFGRVLVLSLDAWEFGTLLCSRHNGLCEVGRPAARVTQHSVFERDCGILQTGCGFAPMTRCKDAARKNGHCPHRHQKHAHMM